MEAQNTNGRRLQLADQEPDTTIARLNWLLSANAEIAREKKLYPTLRDREAIELMSRPVSPEKTFATLGLLLGLLPPAAVFSKFMFGGAVNNSSLLVFLFLTFVTAVTASMGYLSGFLLGKIIGDVEKLSRTALVLLLPFIGIAWGGICGIAGGIFIFIIGAFFGALIGGSVGAVALPVFVFFHMLLKKGNQMELRHLLPIAFGISLTICAAILGR